MAKRGPQSELNDRNWDDEEEVEEAGVFKQATADTMQNRVIKRAKRRGGGDEGEAKSSAFGGFGGLMAKAAPTTSSPMIGLGVKPSTDNKPFSSGFKFSSTTTSDSNVFSSTGGAATSPVDNSVESATGKNDSSSTKDNSSYLQSLKALNESVLAWIKQHVDKNPYIILTPIFKDYEKYVASLDAKKAAAASSNGSVSSSTFSSSASGNKNNATDTKTTASVGFSAFSTEKSLDSKVGKEDNKNTEVAAKTPAFTFGSTSASNGEGFKFSTASATTTNSGFSFGKATAPSISSGFQFGNSMKSSAATTATTTAASTGFSFGSSSGSSTSTTATASPFGGASGFSFGTLAAAKVASDKAQAEAGGGEDDEYVPPKPEVKEIKEEGSLYSKRCKLFHQKEGVWVERGVGNVHVKPLDEPKTQLLIRADTNLGNILLNINLTSALPISRQGKNNVLLVCVPNPPLKEGSTDQTPIPMLIRVKTTDEADELLAKLNERKALL